MTRSLTGNVRRAGRELMQQFKGVAGTVVSEATDAIAREAEREGLTPQRLGRRLRRAASNVRAAVMEAIENT